MEHHVDRVFKEINVGLGRLGFVLIAIGVVLLCMVAWLREPEAVTQDPYSQRTLKALQDSAKAQERQAKALEDISRKLGVCECECKD